MPRIGSDTIGRTITNSSGIKSGEVDAYWIAYELLFCLCKEFVESDVSVILDLTMGWAFQWENLDRIVNEQTDSVFLPIILRSSHEECLERIRQRHEARPEYYDPPEVFANEPKQVRIRDYLADINRQDVRFVDSDRPLNEV